MHWVKLLCSSLDYFIIVCARSLDLFVGSGLVVFMLDGLKLVFLISLIQRSVKNSSNMHSMF